MKPQEFDAILEQSFADGHLSRAERKAIAARIEEAALDANAVAELRARTFAFARQALKRREPEALLGWLEDMLKALTPASTGRGLVEAHFSPGTACRQRIIGLLRAAQRTVDICVFTITDDAITEAILEAHRRGVRVRILSDNDKSTDPGSDLERLERAGIPVAIDASEKHMHHKFALFDGARLVTGSYNWTRSAADHNEENLVVLDDARAIAAFEAEFAALWARMYRG